VEFDLGSSTGSHWKLRELLGLAGEGAGGAHERLLDTELVYSRTAGGTALREAIAEMQGIQAEQVLVVAGAAEALWHVFLVAAEPGANVITPFPCFPPHRTMPEALGLEVRSYHLRRENGYRIDLDEVRQLADSKTRVLLINLPNNPTGATLSDADMRSLHDFAAERGIQFVADEVHHPIYHERATASAARLPLATSIGDFSKAFSLPGLRLGWLIEPDPRRRAQYLNAREYVTISNTPMAELVAEIAVHHRELLWGRTREVAGTNLKLLDKLISEYSSVLAWVRPQGGMTGFPWLVSGADSRELCQAAVEQGLLLAPGDCFGVPEHFRLGFGVSSDWFPRAIERFAGLLDSWGRVRRASRRMERWSGSVGRIA
jgi:aspartate/methionine/tyrosine aminotransferase